MRNVTDGRQQLDRRESDAIIAGQLSLPLRSSRLGGWGTGEKGGWREGVHRGMQLRVAQQQHHTR